MKSPYMSDMDGDRTDCAALAGDPDLEESQSHLLSDEKTTDVVYDVTESTFMSFKACDESNEEGEKTTDTDGVPYDRGWAWMVLLGNFINYFLISGYIKSGGVIFVELLQRFQAPTSHTALLFSVRGAVFSIGGLFVMNAVIDRIGCRKTVLIGALLMSFSAILSSFANNLTLLICLQGVLLGLADPMLTAGEVLTAVYFRRKRALALSIMKTGISLGSVSYPPLLTLLLSRYGLHGALLLTGAISLHSLPAALLLRPLPYFRARANRWSHGNSGEADSVDTKLPGKVASSAEDNLCSKGRKASIPGSCGDLVAVPSAAEMCVSGNTFTSTEASEDLENDSAPVDICISEKTIPSAETFSDGRKASFLKEVRLCDKKDCSKELDSETKSASDKCGPDVHKSLEPSVDPTRTISVDCPSLSQYPETEWYKSTEEICTDAGHDKNVWNGKGYTGADRSLLQPDRNSSCKESTISENHSNVLTQTVGHAGPNTDRKCSIFLKWSRSKLSVLDLSLLARPSFRVLLLYFMLSQTVNVTMDYFPALVKQNQLPKHRAAQLLSIIGGVDFVGRLLSGLMAQMKVSMVPVMLMSSLTTLGVMYQLVRFLTTFPLLACLAVVHGLLAGVVNCMLPVLIVHVVGVKDMGKGIGFQFLAEGMFLAAYHPLLGYIRDATNSYVAVYHVVGFGLLTAVALLGIEEILRRREIKARREY